MTAAPANVWALVHADPERVVAGVREQLAELAARVVLAHLAVRRKASAGGHQELADVRLEHLGRSLREAAEDARGVERALAHGRLRPVTRDDR
jgi:hypothetical protein